LENDYFSEIGENNEFQLGKNEEFSAKNRQYRAYKAPYRKISIYTKNLKRYKLERKRRRQVRLLSEKGLTQKQIAAELGVSVRTVKRDWAKLHSCIKGEFNRQIREILLESQESLDRSYEGLTLKEQIKLLTQDIKTAMKSRPSKKQTKQAPLLIFTLNLEEQTPDGFPTLKVSPERMQFSGNLTIILDAIKNGQRRILGGLQVSSGNHTKH
jgi:transcriptional regulator with XRE-family HTH domain